MVAATLAFQAATDCDFAKLTPAGNYQVAGLGMREDWCGDALGRRTIIERGIQRADDWLHLPTTLSDLEMQLVAAAAQLRQQLPAELPLLATVFSPLTQAVMLAGPEAVAQPSSGAALRAGVETLTRRTESLLQAYAAVGVDGIYYAAQHLSSTVLPRDVYADLGQAIDQRVATACAGFVANILHVHGSGIHLDFLPQGGRWLVHYELAPGNPSPEQFRAHSDLPAVVGAHYSLWQQCAAARDLAPLRALQARFAQANVLLAADCVVPLAVRDSEVGRWVGLVREFS